MLWDLPFPVRFTILFVLIPLLDKYYKKLVGYRLIPYSFKYQLKYFNKFCYYYGWYLLFKTILIIIINKASEYVWSLCYYNDFEYSWFVSLLGYFSIGYFTSLLYMKFQYKIIKWLAMVALIGGLCINIINTSILLDFYGPSFLNNDLVWQPLLGLVIIYRFMIEIVARS